MSSSTGLAELSPLIGRWNVQMTFADRVLAGSATFEWLQPSGLVLMRSHTIDSDLPPKASAVIGFDDSSSAWSMVYHDDRGVSRIYTMTFDGRNWTLEGKPKDFHQRFLPTVESDQIDAMWEKSSNGTKWTEDFRVVYRRQ